MRPAGARNAPTCSSSNAPQFSSLRLGAVQEILDRNPGVSRFSPLRLARSEGLSARQKTKRALRFSSALRKTVGFLALSAEGTAAAASGFDIRIVELETRAFQGLDEVHFRSIQIQQAGLIHEDL